MGINQNIVSLAGKILVANIPTVVRQKTLHLLSNKAQYQKIADTFKNGMKWWCVGAIHELECAQNFNCYLGNGQPFNKVTTIVPKGRGAFAHFNDGAIDALRLEGADKITDWSIGNVLYFLEGFNGYGYSLYKGINSPYLWSGSDKYKSGKYISDHVYDPKAVSTQIGTALLIKDLDSQGLL